MTTSVLCSDSVLRWFPPPELLREGFGRVEEDMVVCETWRGQASTRCWGICSVVNGFVHYSRKDGGVCRVTEVISACDCVGCCTAVLCTRVYVSSLRDHGCVKGCIYDEESRGGIHYVQERDQPFEGLSRGGYGGGGTRDQPRRHHRSWTLCLALGIMPPSAGRRCRQSTCGQGGANTPNAGLAGSSQLQNSVGRCSSFFPTTQNPRRAGSSPLHLITPPTNLLPLSFCSLIPTFYRPAASTVCQFSAPFHSFGLRTRFFISFTAVRTYASAPKKKKMPPKKVVKEEKLPLGRPGNSLKSGIVSESPAKLCVVTFSH